VHDGVKPLQQYCLLGEFTLKNVSILYDQYKKYGIQGPSHSPLPGSPSSVIHLQYTHVTTVTDKQDNQDIAIYKYTTTQVNTIQSNCNTLITVGLPVPLHYYQNPVCCLW